MYYGSGTVDAAAGETLRVDLPGDSVK